MSRAPFPRTAPGVSLALCLAGCAPDEQAGAVVVGLTTDMAVGFELRRLELTTTAGDSPSRTEVMAYGGGDLTLPAEVVIDAGDGDGVEVVAAAFSGAEAGAPLVTRTAATVAAGGRALFLPLPLEEACAGFECAAGTTCIQGVCESSFVASSDLSEHDPAWIEAAPDACKTPSSGAPALVIGKGESAYAPLRNGEVVTIEPGSQGGHHAWLALRVTGLRQMGSKMTARGTFPGLGVELSPMTSIVTLRKAGGGDCEIHGVRFQVDRGIPVDAVRGQPLDVEITLEDTNGDAATAARRIVIAD